MTGSGTVGAGNLPSQSSDLTERRHPARRLRQLRPRHALQPDQAQGPRVVRLRVVAAGIDQQQLEVRPAPLLVAIDLVQRDQGRRVGERRIHRAEVAGAGAAELHTVAGEGDEDAVLLVAVLQHPLQLGADVLGQGRNRARWAPSDWVISTTRR
jgi:hypothetical protein